MVAKIVTKKLECLDVFIEKYPKIFNYEVRSIKIVMERVISLNEHNTNAWLEYEIASADTKETMIHRIEVNDLIVFKGTDELYDDIYLTNYDLKNIANSLVKNKRWILDNTKLFSNDYEPNDYDLADDDSEYFLSAVNKYQLNVERDNVRKNARVFWDSSNFYAFIPAVWFGNPDHFKNGNFTLRVQWQNFYYKEGYFIFFSVTNDHYMIEFLAKEQSISSSLSAKPVLEGEIRVPHHMKVVIYDKDIVAERNIILLPEITSNLEKLIRYQIMSETSSEYDMSFVTIFGEGEQWDGPDNMGYSRYTPYGMNGCMEIEVDETDIAKIGNMYGEIRYENNEEED